MWPENFWLREDWAWVEVVKRNRERIKTTKRRVVNDLWDINLKIIYNKEILKKANNDIKIIKNIIDLTGFV